MAATNVKDRYGVSKVTYARQLIGTGTPIGDLASDTDYPIGSSYLDSATGREYHKLTAETWTSANLSNYSL